MKRVGKILICLAGGLALCAISRADDAVLPGNPYAPIVARNVFGLNPPAPVDVNPSDATPPPKISLNGIMTIFGSRQALFKTPGVAEPGKPAKDESYILGEGQQQDDIEVTRIDEKKGIVTFNNHGVVQEIPLANAVATTAAPSAAPPHLPVMPGRPGFHRFGEHGGNNEPNNEPLRTIPTRNGRNQFGQPTSFNSMGQNGSTTRPVLSGEDQQVLIAAQKAEYEAEGNPIAKLFPPTKYDGQAETAAGLGSGSGGSPQR